MISYRILGPLQAWEGDQPLRIGGAKQRGLLALLLLNRNRVVSVDRLIDELWGEWPPATAAKSVQVYVARLRKVLGGNGALVTEAPGYMLRVAPEQLDLDRFVCRSSEGRALLAAGKPSEAAAALREALSLWRGSPLQDLAFERFAQRESAQLEELRCEALEVRIDADLALGRHAQLVSELEVLVRESPLREGLSGQLMLALYRCGRQAEALAVYRRTRRCLVDEVGAEPGAALHQLERAILQHDPALELSPAVTRATAARSRRGRARYVGVLAVVAAAVIAVLVSGTRGGGSSVSVAPNSLVAIDPASGAVVHQLAVGTQPGQVAIGNGSVWVLNSGDGTVSRIALGTFALQRTIPIAAGATGITVGASGVWIARSDGHISRIDPAFDTVTTLAMRSGGFRLDPTLNDHSPIIVAGDGVWYANNTTVSRVDPRSGRVASSYPSGESAAGISVGYGAVWVADNSDNTVVRIDPTSGSETTIPVGHSPTAIVAGAGSVWVTDTADNAVVRIDPATGAIIGTVPVGRLPSAVVVGFGSVWVANAGGGSVSRIDPHTGHAATIELGNSPSGIAVADGRVFVSVAAAIDPTVARAGATAYFSAPADLDSTDPALAGDRAAQQLEYATCVKLVNYPDAAGAAGQRLVPEAASAMPAVTNNGRTYMFTVRSGYRFSPPSDQPVTAHTFAHTIERTLHHGMGSPADAFMTDIVGARAYMAGHAPGITGLRVVGQRLSITLEHPAGDFLARIATPYFCAVPTDTPMHPQTQPVIPAAGPYYVANYTPGRQIQLRRNPNYHGPRPHQLAAIDYTIGTNPAQTVRQIEANRVDYAVSGAFTSPIPAADVPYLRARYGIHQGRSPASGPRYLENSAPGNVYLALNSNRALFANPKLRRAVGYAINRAALSRADGYAFAPGDHYISPVIPGFAPAHIYPLTSPNLKAARRLASNQHHTAILYTCTGCTDPLLEQELQTIGITVVVKQLPIAKLLVAQKTPGAPFDLVVAGSSGDYLDPYDYLREILRGNYQGATRFNSPPWQQRLTAANSLTGAARLDALGHLDVELARTATPWVPLGYGISQDFVSAHLGCLTYQPAYGLDITALCIRNR